MPTFAFRKLVRDNIIDQQLADGAKPLYWRLSDDEHTQQLVQKIIEEVQEVPKASRDEVAGELADVQQALDDLREKLGVTTEAVKKAQEKKFAKNGGFKEGFFVEHVEVTDDNQWIPHYRNNPDRYPEIT